MAVLALLIAVAALSGYAAAEDVPSTHLVLLQFNLEGDDPYEFAAYATEFAETIEKILSKGYEFETVNAVVLGVGKTDCGISVITIIEYTKNQTESMDVTDIIQYIINAIESNKSLFEDSYDVKGVRSVDVSSGHVKYKNEKDDSTAVLIGSVVGCLCFIGVAAALAVGAAIYITRKRKAYVKVPLVVDDPSERKWLKLPGAAKPASSPTPIVF